MDDPALPARTRLGPPGRRRRRASPRATPRGRAAGPARRCGDAASRAARAPGRRRTRLLVRPRPARGRRGAGHDRARRPAGRLRRQADRVQGRRAAAGGVPARARARAARAAGDRRLRGVPGRAGAARRAARRRRPRGRAARRAARTGASCRSWRAFLDADADAYRAPPRLATASPSPGGSTTPSSPTCCPAAEAMAVTSTFPEAFGMVAAEAAACGALPVVANHSGLGEVARTLREAVPRGARRGSRSRSADDAVAAARRRALGLARRARGPARRHPRRRSSRPPAPATRGTASPRTVIAAAQGELSDLPEPV